ncbi:hypothetical protein EDB86DRAFT_2826608 [Lactarius hatsudake]|nr:hypothetical protein EDB86DRAFT_2826608 [Lactarius hatsudake]
MARGRRSAKKRKLDPGCLPSREAKSQASRLDVVPVEILAEILYYVTSPKDVLSVARCNRRLCTTLLNPSNVMIWRRARNHCIVPGLPPPPPGWSESAYAAFIFDAGNCDICGVWTQRMFLSFVVRVRLCGKHLAQALPLVARMSQNIIKQRLRRLDMRPSAGIVSPWPADHNYYYCLRTDLEEVTTEYEEMVARGIPRDEYLLHHEADIQLQRRVLEAQRPPLTGWQHASLLFEWRQMWSRKYRLTQASNTAFRVPIAISARNHARAAGWDLHDLLNNPTYLSLHRSHKQCLETIPESVVDSLTTRIDTEILSQMEKKERKQKTHAQQIRRADIARHYDRLVERKSHPMLPTLAEFRGLPIIKALQDRDDTAPLPSDSANSSSAGPVKISQVLKSELKRPQLIGGMINNDLKQWADTALREFDAILGQPNWKRASTKLLAPLREGHAAPVSLDLREACAHGCAGHHRKAAAKRKPRADQFVPDQKAVDVLSRALTLMGLRAEHRETEGEVGHCRRHDKMEVALVSAAEAVAMTAGHQYDAGSFALYTARTDEANKIRQTKTFGCRHCPHEILKPTRARRSQKSGDGGERRFTFDGLVSHAKEKHGIYPMGEEDFYRDTRIAKEEVQKLVDAMDLRRS